MAVLPEQDKRAIRNAIITDSYILSLGFTPDYTYSTNTTDDKLEGTNKQIFIYDAQSRNAYNEKTIECVYEIDISVPVNLPSIADKCAQQIISILQDLDIGNGTALDVQAPSPAALACANGYYCVGIYVSHQVTKYNEKIVTN